MLVMQIIRGIRGLNNIYNNEVFISCANEMPSLFNVLPKQQNVLLLLRAKARVFN